MSLLIFEAGAEGHRALYMDIFIHHAAENPSVGVVTFAISELLANRLSGETLLLLKKHPNRLKMRILTSKEVAVSAGLTCRFLSSRNNWKLALNIAEESGSTQIHFPLLDDFLVGAMRMRKTSFEITGIYFRPTMHFSEYWCGMIGGVRQIVKEYLFKKFLVRSDVSRIYCFDRYFVAFASQKYPNGWKVCTLAEPFDPPQAAESSVSSKNRVRFLLFGALQARKGVLELLAALRDLPRDVIDRAHFTVCGEGEMGDEIEASAPILHARGVRFEFRRGFLPQEELDRELAKADVILAPYRNHLGSSGAIYIAAALQKPIIAQETGLIGRQVREYGLGRTVDTSSPAKIAEAISDLTRTPSRERLKFDKRVREFSQSAGVRHFAEAILRPVNIKELG